MNPNKLGNQISLTKAIKMIKYGNRASNAIQMKQDGKYLLLGHGTMLEGFYFEVPTNINFITLTKVGHTCVFNSKFDKEIINFYKKGSTIFNNNDLGETLSPDGELLLATL